MKNVNKVLLLLWSWSLVFTSIVLWNVCKAAIQMANYHNGKLTITIIWNPVFLYLQTIPLAILIFMGVISIIHGIATWRETR